jgi:integrative and conjugative element protein (TIGR02256 family)
VIEVATGPKRADIRTRFSYQPDRRAAQTEINHFHRKGLFFVGDWHTHPEPMPKPSPLDRQSIREAFTKSNHHLNGFLLMIAGTANLPQSLYVAVHSATETIELIANPHTEGGN